jgi:hypothetical protein
VHSKTVYDILATRPQTERKEFMYNKNKHVKLCKMKIVLSDSKFSRLLLVRMTKECSNSPAYINFTR